jgi:hypothetical protein
MGFMDGMIVHVNHDDIDNIYVISTEIRSRRGVAEGRMGL